MLLIMLYCGFYLTGLVFARWFTLPRQAVVSGLGTTSAALVATLTLWLLTRTQLTEPWLAIAMTGAIALPALMLGLGLLAGGWVRLAHRRALAFLVAAILPTAFAMLSVLP